MARLTTLRQRRSLRVETLEGRLLLDGQLAATIAEMLAETVLPPAGEEQPPSVTPETPAPSFVVGDMFNSADELARYLTDAAVERWSSLFGRDYWQNDSWRYASWWFDDNLIPGRSNDILVGAFAQLELTEATGQPVPVSALASYDSTNTQVGGVDEGDIVKTDGQFIYLLTGSELAIIDVRDPGQMQVVSRRDLGYRPVDLLVSGDRLVVISPAWDMAWIQPAVAEDGMTSIVRADGNVTGRPTIWPPVDRYRPQLVVELFDVADRSAPRSVQQTRLDGNLVQSRAIGDTVWLVTSVGLEYPRPQAVCDDSAPPDERPGSTEQSGPVDSDSASPAVLWLPPGNGVHCVYETQDQYVARIESEIVAYVLPQFSARGDDSQALETQLLNQPADILRPVSDDPSQIISVVAFDLASDSPGPVSATSLPGGWVSQVHVTDHSLYLLTSEPRQTGILKFDMLRDQTGVELVASGQVAGRVSDPFWVDEYDGLLRVVVQDGWREELHTDLLVLRQQGTALEPIGSVEGLAPGEQLFSVRFEGERAYVVTFGLEGGLFFDPLFTIDLSDPANPTVEGELVIPGFSEYLHRVGENHLIGVGQDVDPETGLRGEPKVSLFDISSFDDPQLVDEFSLHEGAGWSWTEVAGNHHAFNYFADQRILTVPIQISRPWDGTNGQIAGGPVSGLWVLQVDTETGSLLPLGRVEHSEAVRRSLRIGDELFTVSASSVQAHPLLDPGQVLSEVSFRLVAVDDRFGLDPQAGEMPLDVLANDLIPTSGRSPADLVQWTEPRSGGRLRWSDDGSQLLYTPADDFVGIDRFTYWLDDTVGRDSAVVSIFVPGPDRRQVEFQLEVTDPAGNPVSEVAVGDPLVLNVYVQDVGSLGRGVFAAFLDVSFDADLATAAGPIEYGDAYRDFRTGNVLDGLLDEVGAISGLRPLEDGTYLLYQVTLMAERPGQLVLQAEAANDLPSHDVLVYGFDDVIPEDWIEYGHAVVSIVEPRVEPEVPEVEIPDEGMAAEYVLHNAERPFDVNGDGIVAPGDLLLVVNDLNLHGARSLSGDGPPASAVRSSQRRLEGEAVTFRYRPDVNADRHLSAADALAIVNWMNQAVVRSASSSVGSAAETQPRPVWIPPATATLPGSLESSDFESLLDQLAA
ncbi:MAG: beta-propeller domain-containing protein, partial [Pirellulaceae bacterium]|nr:beta-propeller domain-containing protein [Pirellulaceae bacterium]